MRTFQFVPILALFVLASPSAVAQELVYLLGAEATVGDQFGQSVGDAGDVDMDGVPDLIVGAPYDDGFHPNTGAIYLYSGRTGGLLWSLKGEAQGDAFGWSVDGIGDVNGDGVSDVIVGAPLFDAGGSGPNNQGKVYVLSGVDGLELASHSLVQEDMQFGTVVRGLGDIDGDSVGDYAVGAPLYDGSWLLINSGLCRFYSGATSNLIFQRSGAFIDGGLGSSVDVIRATSNPTTSRVIFGEPGADGPTINGGKAYVHDGAGAPIATIAGNLGGAQIGYSVAGIGDFDGDGNEDFAIGAPFKPAIFIGQNVGDVGIYSGATNSLMHTLMGPAAGAYFGMSLAGFGDMNGDGYDDLLIGSPNYAVGGLANAGEVRVVAGMSGGTLASYSGGIGDQLGRQVSSAGDLNQDGTADFIIGANEAPAGQGQAQVHLSRAAAPTVYCSAKINSQGCTPAISTQGVASLSIADSFHVFATDVLNNKSGLLFWGHAQNNAPFMGGTLCVQAPLTRAPVQNSGGNAGPDDCSGSYDFHFSQAYMTDEGVLPGDRIHAQYWTRDPAASYQVGLTDAVAFDVLP